MTNHCISRRQLGSSAPRGNGSEAKQARARAVAMSRATMGAATPIPTSTTAASAPSVALRLLFGLAISGLGTGHEVQPAVDAGHQLGRDLVRVQERVAPAARFSRHAGAS